MLKNNFKYILFLLVLLMVSCAKRGSITGGLKDTLSPIMKVSFPKNYSTNFKGKDIKITFDEFIKLKDLNKQLIISPPMKQEPIITPTTISKYVGIRILDSLRPNTTYSFNFGQSIVDNNEGNVLNQFKYVFSTGSYIDSLSVKGTVKDAYTKDVESFVSVMLYEVDDHFKDSIVYKENPIYITNTLDSSKTFKLENLKAGKYFLVAMKDYNSNHKFNSIKEKIGFHKQFITVPSDSVYELKLFKETQPFKALRPYQVSKNRLVLPYEGIQKGSKITLKTKEAELATIITKFPKKDSLQVWFKPLKTDSLTLAISKDKYNKSYTFKNRDSKKDTLKIKSVQTGILKLKDRFSIVSNIPLDKVDSSKIMLFNKDSVSVDFKTEYDDFNQQLFFDFKKEPLQKYTFRMMPGALTDFLEQKSDTLIYKFTTKDLADYGNLKVNLENVKHFPVIVELTDDKGKVLDSRYSEDKPTVEFNLIDPDLYTLRLIYDDNKNKQWDPGNYLEKRQAEEVVYFSKGVDVRANWDVDQVFDVSIPYSPPTIPNKKAVKKKKPAPAKSK